MNSCILLAAGSSTRFGSSKALARIMGETVIERLLDELLKSKLDEIIVVLGAHEQEIRPLILKHKSIKVVYNKDHNLGQSSSFKCGLRALDQAGTGILLLPVDHPLLQAGTVDRLIAEFVQAKAKVLIPTFNGKRGHPPVFSIDLLNEFLALSDDRGINTVVHRHANETKELAVKDPGVIKAFNTPQELESLRLREIS